ncbi:MAG TPA: RNA-binding protein [Planctomycetota bacterium]|nr:RNA-binding protein [Planctomycetota bacterium]
MKTLFIRNLPFTTSEADLRKAFEAFGRVTRCSIAKNRETGQSRGFGFVDMDDEAATRAISEMNGREFERRQLIVQESDPRARAGAPTGGGAPGPRPVGGPPRPGGGSPGTAPRPGTGGPASRNFGPPAPPGGSQRFVEKPKDRLKPYKRDKVNFRDLLSDDEEGRVRKDRDGADEGGGGEAPG